MRRIMIGVAVALCAIGVLAAPAFAKEKVVFGEFDASIVGQNLETTPGVLRVAKEGSLEIKGLQLAAKPFGPIYRKNVENPVTHEIIHKAGTQDTEQPCEKVKLTGLVKHEKSSSLTFDLRFSKCVYVEGSGEELHEKFTSFTLGVTLKSELLGRSRQERKRA